MTYSIVGTQLLDTTGWRNTLYAITGLVSGLLLITIALLRYRILAERKADLLSNNRFLKIIIMN